MLQLRAHDSCRTPVRLIEVSPRDGLQNESAFVPTARKIALINALSRTGVAEIEAGSFVSPAALPQLADSDEVFRAIERVPGVIYSALVPNERGLERARAASVNKIAIFTAASDSFTRHNIKATVQESLARFRPIVAAAKRDGMVVRGYVSTVVFCPYEGRISWCSSNVIRRATARTSPAMTCCAKSPASSRCNARLIHTSSTSHLQCRLRFSKLKKL